MTARVYHVTRCDESDENLEAAALARASRVLVEPVIDRVDDCGTSDDGVALRCYQMVGEQIPSEKGEEGAAA